MNQETAFQVFVSKYMNDAEFRTLANADVGAALESLGVEITAQVQAAIDQFSSVSGQLDLAKLTGAVENGFVGMQ